MLLLPPPEPMATTVTTAAATTANMQQQHQQQQQQQQQRPLRGISIIIEADQQSNSNDNNNSNIAEDEKSLKSQQQLLLAFGDSDNNNDSNNLQQKLQAEQADSKVDFETSYNTAATTAAATTTTKLYPQLLLRIGQTEAEVEAVAATEAPTATTTTTTTTIISCNVADDVRNVLLPAAAAVAGEIEESNTNASQPTLVEHAAAAASSASTETETQTQAQTVANSSPQHTVKIQIANAQSKQEATNKQYGKQISVVKLNDSQSDSAMLLQQQQQQQQQQPQAAAYQLCYLVSSGQYSPCETLDSGTGSDLESKSPSSSSSQQPKLELHLKTTRIRVNSGSKLKGKGNHLRAYSLTDSEECEDESSSSLSCDSLHSNEAASLKLGAALLPTSLLRDIRDRERERERDCERLRTRARQESLRPTLKLRVEPLQYEADQFYNFHMNEHANCRSFGASSPDYAQFESEQQDEREDAFAGYKDMRRNANAAAAAAAAAASSTIRSAKGTVRGVKNRVRNGVATFLQLQQPNVKSYKDKDLGKVVLYTTSMGIIRDTYAKCANVKQILRTLLIKFEERDVFMSLEYQQEMRERMQQDTIRVPQLFVEGQHIGDADTVERLNESGELRQLLRPYKSIATAYTCQTCGGYRLLPCPSCNGSKKSMHRNHFTAEFMALKCMNCDEVGLVKCPNC